mgnify:CR=1 FL=1
MWITVGTFPHDTTVNVDHIVHHSHCEVRSFAKHGSHWFPPRGRRATVKNGGHIEWKHWIWILTFAWNLSNFTSHDKHTCFTILVLEEARLVHHSLLWQDHHWVWVAHFSLQVTLVFVTFKLHAKSPVQDTSLLENTSSDKDMWMPAVLKFDNRTIFSDF